MFSGKGHIHGLINRNSQMQWPWVFSFSFCPVKKPSAEAVPLPTATHSCHHSTKSRVTFKGEAGLKMSSGVCVTTGRK